MVNIYSLLDVDDDKIEANRKIMDIKGGKMMEKTVNRSSIDNKYIIMIIITVKRRSKEDRRPKTPHVHHINRSRVVNRATVGGEPVWRTVAVASAVAIVGKVVLSVCERRWQRH